MRRDPPARACFAAGARRAAALAFAALATTLAAASLPAWACELLALDHRAERVLRRWPLPSETLSLAFTHSVLGTEVRDTYRWREGAWVLVEERFSGQGYGLPHQAQAGEQLQPLGGDAWALRTQRRVWPLVLRPVAGMRLELQGQAALALAALGSASIELRGQGCEGADR